MWPSAAPGEIKRSYRRLALKYHSDVNKEANDQEKFLRIKHAYKTLMNSESKSTDAEEQFYGFADFLKDLQVEFQIWAAGLNSE